MKLDDLMVAALEFEIIEKNCRAIGSIPNKSLLELRNIESKYGVTIAQCEVFLDVLKTKDIHEKIRDAIIDVYNSALLDLQTEYLDNHENDKYETACELESTLV